MPDHPLTTVGGGGEEFAANWQYLYSGGLLGSQPTRITALSGGAGPTFDEQGVLMESATNGDVGNLGAGGVTTTTAGGTPPAAVIAKFTYNSVFAQSNISNIHNIGLINGFNASGTSDNVAVFRPHMGDSTSGNVFVDQAGTDNAGTVSYPNTNQINTYTVLLDYSGEYLTSGSTGFYINSDPRRGDGADATISAVPNVDVSFFGIYYENDTGNNGKLTTNYMEVAYK